VCSYLSILPQPSKILETLKHAHVIIMDEMSMMIDFMLCAIKQCLKPAHNNSNPFAKMLLFVIGDTKQFPLKK
jgi:hypothetical protein